MHESATGPWLIESNLIINKTSLVPHKLKREYAHAEYTLLASSITKYHNHNYDV